MLHEILLSLSGHTSPVWSQVKEHPESKLDESLTKYISPPENAMLVTLGHISDLHIQLRDHTKQISSSHPSMICRSVASSISTQPLAQFRRTVIDVEASILSSDAGYVGGYGIVPLSTIVGKFAPWTRRLEWLLRLTRFMLLFKQDIAIRAKCNGALLVDFLERETYTGYSDLEDMAALLLKVAQKAWVQQVSSWIFYGKLPAYGAEDFFIHLVSIHSQTGDGTPKEGSLSRELLPNFVGMVTAESILSIGNSLNHIRFHSQFSPAYTYGPNGDPALNLLPHHLEHLKSLQYPLSNATFARAISLIRTSISENVLSHLLPLNEVIETLSVLHEYLLLGRGEFAVSLIAQADTRILARNTAQERNRPIRKIGRLDDLAMKDAELAVVLHQTFSELASLQKDEELQDDTFERASGLLRLTTLNGKEAEKIVSTIFPSPSILSLLLPENSPLSLFLSHGDIKTYSHISTYLLSIRRAQLHLSSLWKMTMLRRCHPTPLGPPLSSTRGGAARLEMRRAREDARMIKVRKHWAVAGKALFVLNELGAYFQGEVVGRHWSSFREWLGEITGDRPLSRDSRPSSSGKSPLKTSRSSQPIGTLCGSVSDGGVLKERHDPASLAQAHRSCLSAIRAGLMLDDENFTIRLKELLTIIDHFIALFSRLQVVWQGLDLQEYEGVVDALTNYKKDEGEIWWEMERSGKVVKEKVAAVVEWIRDRDRRAAEWSGMRAQEDINTDLADVSLDGTVTGKGYVPWKGRTIEMLIMKLEFLTGGTASVETRGAADGVAYDDEQRVMDNASGLPNDEVFSKKM